MGCFLPRLGPLDYTGIYKLERPAFFQGWSAMLLTTEQRTIADQRVKIEELEEELRNLKEDLDAVTPFFPREWRLTTQQRNVLMALYKSHGTVRREHFFRVIKSSSEHPDALLKVVMVKLRKKIKPVGIDIHNEWKVGYWMDADSKAIIKAALAVPLG